MWYRIRLTLNTGAQPEYNQPQIISTETLYTYTIQNGEEFTGFGITGATTGCKISALFALSRAAACSIGIELSAIDRQSQNVVTDPARSITFTYHRYCGPASFEYQVTYAPASPTANLISLPISTIGSITFA
jgi:hypothetical protein